MPFYTVRYVAGPYCGEQTIAAEDDEQAIAKVRSWVRRQMSLSMYADNYRIVSEEKDSNE